ncbi:LysR family transcriptional regulator [Pseudoduganella sp. GCM10020061]|uniref:LysR family transcriptional regulator n=1 Tax=Pseudoduganella sp. GCM10020061 TaxID=3317345 RepID=UPI00363F8E62
MDAAQRVPAILSFVQTADRGSFASAARALGISPAAVSKNVANLEAALGVRLLNRTTRSQRLTREGEAFLERARVAIEALEAAVDAVAAQRAEVSGTIRISCANNFGLTYLMPLVPGLRARYPALELEIDFDDRQVDIIAEGYDIALRGGHNADSSLVSRQIAVLQTVLVASPGYLATHGVPVRVRDLARHQLISIRFLSGQVSPWNFTRPDGPPLAYRPEQPVLTVSSPFAAIDAAARGIGIAQAGLPHAWELIRDGKLKVLLPHVHQAGSRTLAIQFPHRALAAPRVRAAVDYLAEGFAANEAFNITRDELGPYYA